MPGSFRVARILGIDIRIHISWVLIFLLVLLSLADQVFPDWYPQWSQQKTFLISAIAALLFFTSVLLHELAHAIVALRFKMSVSSITLFLLGGVANLTKEPPSAKAEFFMASAGPLTSLTIGALAFLVQQLVTNNIDVVPSLQPVEGVARYLSFINIAVALFNLVPGFPLDGGRVLRSIIWGVRRDRVAATRIAARGGQLVAGLMVVYGVSRALDGEAMTGLWMFLIAYFLYGAASQALQQERVTAAVGSVRVAQLMTTNFRSAPAGISIGQLIRDIVLPNNLQAIPIVAHDRLVGLVRITDLRKVEQDQWATTPVDAVMTPASEVATVTPDEQIVAAIERFGGGDVPFLPVVDHGSLVGVLFRDAVVGYVRMQETLGLDARRQRVVEAIAARYEDELEAETAAGYLRSLGIEARVRFQASLGLPRSTVPIRVIAPTGGFELLVGTADIDRAREALASAGPPPPRPQRYRWLGWVLIVVLLAPLLFNWILSLTRAL